MTTNKFYVFVPKAINEDADLEQKRKMLLEAERRSLLSKAYDKAGLEGS
ncbi:hypothetical protein [Vibrio maerlii]|nr:hypothetical protein [Vibrio maerlii]